MPRHRKIIIEHHTERQIGDPEQTLIYCWMENNLSERRSSF